MKAFYNLSKNLSVELEFSDGVDLVDKITLLRELEHEPCGKCKSDDTFLRVKESGEAKDKFYAMECANPACRATLNMGVGKDPSRLYAKRVKVDAKGKAVKPTVFLPNNGWVKFDKETGEAS